MSTSTSSSDHAFESLPAPQAASTPLPARPKTIVSKRGLSDTGILRILDLTGGSISAVGSVGDDSEANKARRALEYGDDILDSGSEPEGDAHEPRAISPINSEFYGFTTSSEDDNYIGDLATSSDEDVTRVLKPSDLRDAPRVAATTRAAIPTHTAPTLVLPHLQPTVVVDTAAEADNEATDDEAEHIGSRGPTPPSPMPVDSEDESTHPAIPQPIPTTRQQRSTSQPISTATPSVSLPQSAPSVSCMPPSTPIVPQLSRGGFALNLRVSAAHASWRP